MNPLGQNSPSHPVYSDILHPACGRHLQLLGLPSAQVRCAGQERPLDLIGWRVHPVEEVTQIVCVYRMDAPAKWHGTGVLFAVFSVLTDFVAHRKEQGCRKTYAENRKEIKEGTPLIS